MVRVLVAEDSPTVQDLLVWILQSDPDLQVVGMANDGEEAVRLAARLRPDVITMDIHMPRMDGFQATREIMQRTPTPIVVVSAMVDKESVETSFSALQAGALSVVQKPTGPSSPNYEAVRECLVMTVKLMSEVKVVRHWGRQPSTPCPSVSISPPAAAKVQAEVVAIAASTGGPAALGQILSGLPADFPVPILVVQHISHGFGGGLVSWLDRATELKVGLARQGDCLAPGRVLVAPDGRHMMVRPGGRILLGPEGLDKGLCPSADPFFSSVARAFGPKALGVILTGMGRDGVEGLRQLKAVGGRVLAQDEASCVVFGMPKEAIMAGVVDQVVPLQQMATAIVEML